MRVAFTDHAAERAARYDIPLVEVADTVLVEHRRRRRNAGSADWLVRRGSLVVVYNWPDRRDRDAVRVVTVLREE